MNNQTWGIQLPQPLRPDGRSNDFQLRPISCELNLLSESIGSARFYMGNTSAIAAVRPLNETTRSSLSENGSTTFNERYAEASIYNVLAATLALDKLARINITIILQPETDDGCLLSCLINAAICSILEAGLPCKYTTVSVSIARKLKTQSLVLDPTEEELLNCDLCINYSITNITGNIIQAVPEIKNTVKYEVSGNNFSVNDDDIIGIAKAASQVIENVVRQTISTRLNKLINPTIVANNLMQITDNYNLNEETD